MQSSVIFMRLSLPFGSALNNNAVVSLKLRLILSFKMTKRTYALRNDNSFLFYKNDIVIYAFSLFLSCPSRLTKSQKGTQGHA